MDVVPVPGSVEMYILVIEIADRLAIVLAQEAFAQYSPAQVEEIIERDCLRSPEVAKLVTAGMLATHLQAIQSLCDELFKGLGVAPVRN